MADFEKIIIRIVNEEPVDCDEILKHLVKTGNEERAEIFNRLAESFCLRGENHLVQAAEFAGRAFAVSKNKIKYAPKLIEILTALKDAEKLKKVYKRIGYEYLKLNNVKEALESFDRWLYVYPEIHKTDKYEYDYDILNSIDSFTNTLGFKPNSFFDCIAPKLRIGFLVKDITAFNSVLVKVNYQFAKYFNPDVYELYFFFPETEKQIMNSKQGEYLLNLFQKEGVINVCADECARYADQLLSVANKIKEKKIFLLVTSAALSLFNHYFITSLKPAPIILGLSQGPPPQFIPQNIDWSIAWTYHPLIDSPVPTSHVKLQIDLPNKCDIALKTKEFYGMPEDSLAVYAGGRHVKFQDQEYINSLLNIIRNDFKRYLVLAGFSKEQIPFIDNLADEETLKRVLFFPWLENYLEVVRVCDVAIDTYPSSGGVILFEIMAMGVPVITYKNNYMAEFDQTNWSPFQEFFDIEELKLNRGEYQAITNLADKLLADEELRKDLGSKCAVQISQNVGNPKAMISECENIFMDLILNLLLEKISLEQVETSKLKELPAEYFNKIPSLAAGLTEKMLAEGKYQNVCRLLEIVIKLFPKQPDLLCNLGAANFYLGNKVQALEYLNEAAQIDKNNHIYVMNIAAVYIAENKIEEAVRICKDYISGNNQNTQVGNLITELEKLL